MAKSALILLDGEKPSRKILAEYWQHTDIRICADGAAATCLSYKLTPDLIIGDMDSLDEDARSRFLSTQIIHLADQNTTDGEKAIQYCIDQGYQKVDLFGAQGKRVDHGLYNLGLLRKYHGQVDEMRMVSDDEISFLTTGKQTLSGHPGSRISLLPVFGKAEQVSARGLEYPIENQAMELGGFSSVSNTFSQSQAQVTIGSGLLLVVMERKSS